MEEQLDQVIDERRRLSDADNQRLAKRLRKHRRHLLRLLYALITTQVTVRQQLNMNILSFTNCPLDPWTGSGKTVLNYSQGLRDLGHSVEVCEPKDYRLWPGMVRANKVRTGLGAWSLVNRKLRDRRVDLLEYYGDEFGFSTWRWSQQAKRPLLVAHTNGLELLSYERERAYTAPSPTWTACLYNALVQKSHDWFSQLAFAHADAFVALCELDRKYVLERGFYPEERTAVIEPGLDKEYLSIPFSVEREERIAFTGSWVARKGVAILTLVLTKILGQRPNLQLDIYGSGVPLETVLAGFPTGVQSRIQVHPRLPEQEIANWLARAKVFFFPSQYEGFGIALAEAMACGCASVTTRTGFGAELRDREESLLCDFGDEEAMSAAIGQLLDDDSLRRHVAWKGWQRTRSLTWESNIRKLEAVYSRWVKEHQNRA